jgi:hypothetical protein
MKIFWRTLALFAALTTGGQAHAECFGTGSFRSCSDLSGNSYSIQQFGNTTTMNGSNSRTGSTWNQTSTTMGSTTFNRGTSSDGGSWSTTRQDVGNGNYMINGHDSDGNAVSKSCFYGVCN